MIAIAKQLTEYLAVIEEILIPSRHITPGKSYEVIQIIYHTEEGNWIYCKEPTYNNIPNHGFFWFTIMNDTGNIENAWGSFFLTIEDIRESNLQQIGIV